MQAQTLKDVIRVFDPRKTLDKEDLDEYYAYRILNKKEDPAITKLKIRIFGSDAQKILYSAQMRRRYYLVGTGGVASQQN